MDSAAGMARVPVRVEGSFACSSAECPPRDVVDYSVRISVLVVAYATEDLEVDPTPLGLEYAWDSTLELSESVASTPLDLGPGSTSCLLALRGFSVALDGEKHTLSLGVDVTGERGALLFKGWREKIRRERPPER